MTLQKGSLPKVMRLLSFLARNESEREVTEKQISEWIGDGHKGLFLRPDGDFRPDEEFKSDLTISLKSWVVKLTWSLTTETKSLTCGDKEEPLLSKSQKEIFNGR